MNCSTKEYENFRNEIYKNPNNMDVHFSIIKKEITLITNPTQIKQSPLAGHQGIHRMLGRIGNRFKWQGMTKDVKYFVRKCKVCQMTKLPLQITSTSKYPFERISLDITGPFTQTEEGFKYLLTFQDDLTKFFGACPIRKQIQSLNNF